MNAIDLSAKPVEIEGGLIPDGQLAFVVLKVRDIKTSQSGTRYIDVEMTVDEGQPYAKKKLWQKIMDPSYGANSDFAKNIGLMYLRRILETAFGATPDNDESYKVISDYYQLSGVRVPVKIKVKKEKDERYDDKNEVEFLSPHSSSKKVVKAYSALAFDGIYNINEAEKNGQQAQQGVPPQQQAFSPVQTHPAQQQTAPQVQQQPPVQQAQPQQQQSTQWVGQQQQQPHAQQQPVQQQPAGVIDTDQEIPF